MKDSLFPTIRSIFSNVDPHTEFNRVQDTLDSIFDEFFLERSPLPTFALINGSYPKVNVKENDKEFEIVAATPGLTKEDLTVEFDDGVLQIRGESKQDNVANGERYLLRELKKSSFVRSFKIDETVLDTSNIKSIYENGELRIIVPKHKDKVKKSPLKIQIT